MDCDQVAVGICGAGVGVWAGGESLAHKTTAPGIEGVGAEIDDGVFDERGLKLDGGECGVPESIVGAGTGFEDDAER